MDCSYFGERIDRYIDGELDYMEVAELQSHLSFCPHCAAVLARSGRMRGVLAAWGRVELATPPGFAERVRTAVELEPAPGSPKPLGELVGDWVEDLDRALGRIPLPGGRTIPVMNVIGWGLAAAAAVALELERRRSRRTSELRPL